jgi:hypothetical protein
MAGAGVVAGESSGRRLEGDPREPPPRPDFFHDDVARHLKQKIADEEERCAKAVGVFAQAQIAHHLQLGKADVLAVDVRDQVTDPDERNEPAGDLLDDLRTADARAWRMIHGGLPFSEARCSQARYFLSVDARKTGMPVRLGCP